MSSLPPEYLPKEFTPIITFKDNTILEAKAGFNSTTNELWVWPSNPMTFLEASTVFSDSSKTDYIRVDHAADQSEIFEHYTHIKTILESADGSLAIRLTVQ